MCACVRVRTYHILCLHARAPPPNSFARGACALPLQRNREVSTSVVTMRFATFLLVIQAAVQSLGSRSVCLMRRASTDNVTGKYEFSSWVFHG